MLNIVLNQISLRKGNRIILFFFKQQGLFHFCNMATPRFFYRLTHCFFKFIYEFVWYNVDWTYIKFNIDMRAIVVSPIEKKDAICSTTGGVKV